MKRNRTKQEVDPIRLEYDFSGGMRGKHAACYSAGTNVVVLQPDVAATFPTANEVNEALRALAHILNRRASRTTETKLPNKRGRPTPGKRGG